MIDYRSHLSRAAAIFQESAIRKMGTVGAGVPDLISFAPGYPSVDTFPWTEIRDIATEILSGADRSVLQYGPTRGFKPLLEGLPALLDERGIRAQRDELLITTGSQQALDLVARVLLDPGDVVLVEIPTYAGAITAFRNAQAVLAGVRQEHDGIDFEDLDAVLERQRAAGRRVRFLYVVPNFQNPTGLFLSRPKRSRLIEWASRHGLLIVEDDPYGAIYFDEAAGPSETRPLKADDGEGRVVYLGSFSKTLAPGFRVAWMVAPGPLAAKVEVAKQAADLCTGGLDQRVVYEAWRRGVIDQHAPRLRDHYRHKRDVMERSLRTELGDLATWQQPRGGFFLWVSLPSEIDAEAMLARAIAQRVSYVAGSAFCVDGSGGHLIRLSFSAPAPERLVEGVRRLACAVREEMSAPPVAQRR